MIKKILLSLLAMISLVVIVILFNTFTFNSKKNIVSANNAPDPPPSVLQHLSEVVAFKTVSYEDSTRFDSTQFIALRRYLEIKFPLVHSNLTREVVKGYSLLFTWKGKNPLLNPVVLMAHQDVVPIEEETKTLWTSDPFTAQLKDNFLWGRGAADDKMNLICIFETIEKLLSKNFQPERTIYLAFGHDEESRGTGAIAMAALLKSRGVKADLVLDEGGIITREKIPGMEGRSVALLGTSEKGAMSLQLKVEKSGGHSSMPESETAIDILANAISRLRQNKFEARFSASTEGFLEAVGPEMPFSYKMVFANLWLFTPVVHNIYEQSNAGNAMIRTTIAPTIVQSGMKDNVIPTVATATVNFRMLPGDSSTTVIKWVKDVINDDRVNIEIKGHVREATSVTSPESFGYKQVEQAIAKTEQDIIPSPFLMIAATDSRYFNEVSDNIIKFSPMIDPVNIHGIDERISVESIKLTLWFYEQLIVGL